MLPIIVYDSRNQRYMEPVDANVKQDLTRAHNGRAQGHGFQLLGCAALSLSAYVGGIAAITGIFAHISSVVKGCALFGCGACIVGRVQKNSAKNETTAQIQAYVEQHGWKDFRIVTEPNQNQPCFVVNYDPV